MPVRSTQTTMTVSLNTGDDGRMTESGFILPLSRLGCGGNRLETTMHLRPLLPALLLASAGALSAADEDYRANAVVNQRPMLGIEMSPVPTNIQDREGIDSHQGVLVQSTYPDTAAANMGLQHDDVILGVNGQPISSMTDLRNEIGLTSIGDPIDVQVTRNGQQLTLNSSVRPWPETIPYERLDPAAEKRFRDWQDRRQQRQADDVARMNTEADRLQRQLAGTDAPASDRNGRGHDDGMLAFRFAYVIDAARARPVAAPEIDPAELAQLELPADMPTNTPWRITARIASPTTY